MWPFRKAEPELVTVALNPQSMVCSWIKKEKLQLKNNKNIRVKAYKKIIFKQLEFEKSVLFNLSKMSNHIKRFIRANNIKNPLLALSISGPTVFEKIITLSISTPSDEDFNLPQINTMTCKQCYLGPAIHGGFDFYCCGIRREALFQYNLLAIKSGIKLVTITTKKASHIKLYKHMQGDKFRQGQLSLDLAQYNYDIQNTFTSDHISQQFDIQKEIANQLQKEYTNLATNLGLFLIGSQS